MRCTSMLSSEGAQATVAIEGNTLTIEAGSRAFTPESSPRPQSRAYQEREVRNVLEAFERLDDMVMEDGDLRLSAELICDMNRWVLDGVDPDAASGTRCTIRTHSVVVGPYVGPPARDCWHLLERLAEWLDGDDFRPTSGESDENRDAFARTVLSALLAHLYIAWIHPFADGNGRTARLLEYVILARSGMVPLAAANLMANHFNLTRDRYYARLSAASRERDVLGFLGLRHRRARRRTRRALGSRESGNTWVLHGRATSPRPWHGSRRVLRRSASARW